MYLEKEVLILIDNCSIQILCQYCFQNSLRTVYESLKSDLKRLEEMSRGTNSIGTTVANVSNQLCQFITARIQLIDLSVYQYHNFLSLISYSIIIL